MARPMTKVKEGRWGEALWNQQDRIDSYTAENIAFTDQVRGFVGQVAQVELKYAKEMRTVLRQHERALADQNTTVAQAWRQIFASLDALTMAHESVADKFSGDVSVALATVSRDATKRRKDILIECTAKDAGLAKEMDGFGRERAKFDKLWKDEELASQAYSKAENSDTVTKAKVEKARKAWETKAKIREEGQKKLQVVLDQVNAFRTQFFHLEMPESIDKLQSMDEQRSEAVVSQFAEIANGYAIIGNAANQTAQVIKAAVANHNKTQDSKVFAQLYKTTDYFPGDITIGSSKPEEPAAPSASAQSVPQVLGVEAHAADDDDDLPEMSAAAQYPQVRIQYDYVAEDGSITCTAMEVLGQVANDGSGWVHVMKQDGTQGYVPASYMEE